MPVLRPVPEDGLRPSDIDGRSWRDAWDAQVLALEPDGFLQLWGWGDHLARFGAKVERWAFMSEGNPIGLAQVILESARAGVMASVPHGPACAPEKVVRTDMFARLREEYQGRSIAIRYEPPWLDTAAAVGLLVDSGLRSVPPAQPRSTLVLDLRPGDSDGENALLAEMHQKCRYNIRLAERREVVVERLGEEDLGTFESMLRSTAQRHGLAIRRRDYYRSAFEAFGQTGATIYGARYGTELLSMIMVVRTGRRATYLYGASTERERSRMPNHALQWRAITDARDAGCEVYDFWGIPDELGRASMEGLPPDSLPVGTDGLWGVWQFKRGFGGRIERRVGRWDDVLAPLRYSIGVNLPAAIRRLRPGTAAG